MKRKYLFAAIAALTFLPSMAQTERHYEYDEYGKVGRSEGWARRFAHNFVDGLIGAEYYEPKEQEGRVSTIVVSSETNINVGNDNNVKKSYRHFGPGHTPDFYFGVNLLCTQNPPTMTPELKQRAGKGFEFGLAVGQWGYHMSKHTAVNTAFYITRSRYWIADNKYLDRVDNTVKAIDSGLYDGHNVDQGYLRYWSLRVPLCLEISSASHKGPFIAVGPEIEYRFGELSKVRLDGGSKMKVSKNIGINPLGINAVARIGISDFGIIARYSFTSLFLDDSPVQTYPFMIGISTSF